MLGSQAPSMYESVGGTRKLEWALDLQAEGREELRGQEGWRSPRDVGLWKLMHWQIS